MAGIYWQYLGSISDHLKKQVMPTCCFTADNSLLENIPPTTDAEEGPSNMQDNDTLPVVKRRRRAPEAALEGESEYDFGSDSGSDWDPEGNLEQADEPLNDLVQPADLHSLLFLLSKVIKNLTIGGLVRYSRPVF